MYYWLRPVKYWHKYWHLWQNISVDFGFYSSFSSSKSIFGTEHYQHVSRLECKNFVQHILLELIFVLHFAVVIFGQSFYLEGRCFFFFNPLEDQILWHELFDLLEVFTENQLAKKIYSKKVCAKRRALESLFSVNLFFLDLHQTTKEIQSLAAKEGLGEFSNCSTFGALSHFPLEKHLVNFFF